MRPVVAEAAAAWPILQDMCCPPHKADGSHKKVPRGLDIFSYCSHMLFAPSRQMHMGAIWDFQVKVQISRQAADLMICRYINLHEAGRCWGRTLIGRL